MMKNELPWLLLFATLPACSGEVKLGPDKNDGTSGELALEPPPPDSPYAAVDPASVGCGEAPVAVDLPPVVLCDPTPASGAACVDTLADPHNCGTCGHDCLGGPCENGKCRACQLAAFPMAGHGVGFLAVDPDNVYFTSSVVNKVPRSGGPVTTLSSQYLIVVAVYESDVYAYDTAPGTGWANTLFRIPTSGGEPVPVTSLGAGGFDWVVDGALLFGNFWQGGWNAGELRTVNLADGHTTPLATLGYAIRIGGLDPLRIWGTDSHEPTTFWNVNRTTGSARKVAAPVPGAVGTIKYLDGQIYFAQIEDYNEYVGDHTIDTYDASITPGGIWRMWPDGSHATEIVPCQEQPSFLVLDREGMYWTSLYHLMHLAPGGEPESVHDAPSELAFLTLDNNALFWVERFGDTGNDNRLMKLAR